MGARIFLTFNANIVTVVRTASTSDMGSAIKRPFTPRFPMAGRMIARGISRITFLSSARNMEIFAWPKARKVCWQAHCAPKIRKPKA